MSDTHVLIQTIYAAFNRRDIDAIFRTMNDHIRWPKASEGGEVVGKPGIRAYWTQQWSQFDPSVEPRHILDLGGGKVEVTVHQRVKSLQGELLSDTEVTHIYTISNGRIDRMELRQLEGGAAPTAAFPTHDIPS